MALLVNAYCTVRDLPERTFPYTSHGSRGRADPELAKHLNGFVGFIMNRGSRQMTASLYGVTRHLERVQHQLSFEVDDTDIDAMTTWARAANAILFLPNSTVTDPALRVLVDPADGTVAADAQLPYPADAQNRKQHYDSWIASQGIPVAATLPPIDGEAEVVLRHPQHVATRMVALALVAVRGESINNGDPIPAADMQSRFPQAYAELTPAEALFMNAATPEPQATVNAVWRYEALATLQWALARRETLPYPTALCDVPAVAADILNNDYDTIVQQAALRPASEILDQMDLHLRLHWAVRQAELDEAPLPGALNGSVIQQRRHALNWLTNFAGAGWDDVDTPT